MPKPEQNIMTEGPGLKQRMREENAVMANVAPMGQPPMREPVGTSPVDVMKPNAKFGDKPKEKRIDTTSMTKPLGSFKKGTNYVPKTGTYKLHEGEAVIPKEKNMAVNPYAKITEGMEKKGPKKTLKSMHTRKAHDGSYIHEHHHHAHPMEEHTSPDLKSAMAHMEEHAPTMQAEAPAEPQSGADAQASALGMSGGAPPAAGM